MKSYLLKLRFYVFQKNKSWEIFKKNLNINFRCKNAGLTVPTDFSNCVDGRKVDNFETPYDFNSVMHYGAYA
jgi:hypothetical protein